MSSDDFIRSSYERMKEATDGVPSHRGFRKYQAKSTENADGEDGWKPPPGVAKSSGVTWRNPRPISDVLKIVTKSRDWDASLSFGKVASSWPEIAGKHVAAHCLIESFDDGKLIIRCDSTAWAKQMTLLIPQIEKRIADTVGSGGQLQVIVAGPRPPSWKHGAYSVKGPGPRDTYG